MTEALQNNTWSWRRAVSSEDGPQTSTTRHVLLALSLYMSAKGTSCWPSIASLAEDTGLSERTVSIHIQRAEAEGWITRRREHVPGRSWRRTVYEASAPRHALPELPEAPSGRQPEPHAELPEARAEQPEPDDKSNPKQVPTKSTSEEYREGSKEGAPLPEPRRGDLEAIARELIRVFPHPTDDHGVLRRPAPWPVRRDLNTLVLEGVDFADVLAGARRLAKLYPEGGPGRFGQGLQRWLRDHGWEAVPERARADADLTPRGPTREVADLQREERLRRWEASRRSASGRSDPEAAGGSVDDLKRAMGGGDG